MLSSLIAKSYIYIGLVCLMAILYLMIPALTMHFSANDCTNHQKDVPEMPLESIPYNYLHSHKTEHH
jgi:hypothetical protein